MERPCQPYFIECFQNYCEDEICQKVLPTNFLKMLYLGLVEPHFRYCCSFWGSCGVTTRKTLDQWFSTDVPRNPRVPLPPSRSSVKNYTNATIDRYFNSPVQIGDQGFLEPWEHILRVLLHQKG